MDQSHETMEVVMNVIFLFRSMKLSRWGADALIKFHFLTQNTTVRVKTEQFFHAEVNSLLFGHEEYNGNPH